MAANKNETGKSKTEPSAKKRALFRKKSFVISALVVLLVIAAGFFAYKYVQARNDLNAAKDPAKAAQQEMQNLVNELSENVELPTGETPTLGTISDADKLKQQAFFRNAQNGDKILIYTKAKRAVLYRPSSGRVIEYSIVDFNEAQAPAAPQQ